MSSNTETIRKHQKITMYSKFAVVWTILWQVLRYHFGHHLTTERDM